MSISAEIVKITTEDAAPTSAPFKISAKTGKTSLTLEWKVVSTGTIRAWRVRIRPLNRNSGQLVARRGMVCGSGDRCGTADAMSLSKTSPLTVTNVIEESEVAGEPDGEIPVGFWAMSETDGWSS